jgi:hypothetical protein
MVELAAGLCGMAFAFPATSPRQPLWKGLTEDGVEGLNKMIQTGREKNKFLNLQFILVFYLLFNL